MSRRRSHPGEGGQAIVEFAIVLPLLAMLLLGLLQLGLTLRDYLALTDAVRAGARKAAVSREVGNPATSARSAVVSAAGELDTARLDVTVKSSWRRGADVTIEATYPYAIDVLGLVVKSGRLTAKTTERVE